jgi:hypothetical protein
MKVVQLVLGLVGIALIVFFTLFGQTILAADPTPKIEIQCRAILEQNFAAVVAEDLKALRRTSAKDAGTKQQQDEFCEEAKQMFADTDVYMRLVDFQILRVQMPMAEAMVLQLTLPAAEADREPVLHQKLGLNFRHHSALLPEYELVAYKQLFKYEGGKWKVHLVSSVPVAAETNKLPELPRPNCPNGNCQFPRIKTAAFR